MGTAAMVVVVAVIWSGASSGSGDALPVGGSRKVPTPATVEEFDLPDLGGQMVRLSSLTGGKPFAISFGTLACPNCRDQMAVFETLNRKYDNQVVFIEVYVGERREHVAERLSEEPVSYPVLLDAKGTIFFRYGSRGVPVTVVGDADRRLLIHKQGPVPADQLVAVLDQALAALQAEAAGQTRAPAGEPLASGNNP